MAEHLTVGDVVRAVEEAFPPAHAEPWDRVGLLAGDPLAPVTGVLLGLDVDSNAITHARRCGANLLLTHHPAWLDAPARVIAGGGSGGLLFEALRSNVALACAHTNLDRSVAAQRAMPERLGLRYERPLEGGLAAMKVVTVFVPHPHLDAVSEAMSHAGAGRIGSYDGCSFTVSGHGRFTPRTGAAPQALPDDDGVVEEDRLEMVCPAHLVGAVVASVVASHPYEEPLVTVCDADIARGSAALGALSRCEPLRLRDLAAQVATAYGIVPRVWGDPDRVVCSIATATGSAGSLVGSALKAAADVLVAGEVRYHDATAAVSTGLGVIEVGHDVSEWPLVDVLADLVRSMFGANGVDITVMQPSPGWWTP